MAERPESTHQNEESVQKSEEEEEDSESESESVRKSDSSHESDSKSIPKPPDSSPASSVRKGQVSENEETESESERQAVMQEPNIQAVIALASKPLADMQRKSKSKRPMETDGAERKSKMKLVKKQVEKEKPEPRKLFERIWSEDDEITLLKGLIEYSAKELNPSSNRDGFHDFIQKSIHVEVTKSKLGDKIRKMKKMYKKKQEKGLKIFNTDHQRSVFQLSEKLWGNHKSNVVRKEAIDSKSLESYVERTLTQAGISLDANFLDEDDGLKERWWDLRRKELEFSAMKMELIADHTKMFLDASGSSTN